MEDITRLIPGPIVAKYINKCEYGSFSISQTTSVAPVPGQQ